MLHLLLAVALRLHQGPVTHDFDADIGDEMIDGTLTCAADVGRTC